jgi:hypothetical protein
MNPLNQKTSELRQKVINFIATWHSGFILDYWWRKKYNVPFGSLKHRSMNFIDMYIEYQEEIEIKNLREKAKKSEEEYDENIHVSQEEIDEDYEKLNLEEFNNG